MLADAVPATPPPALRGERPRRHRRRPRSCRVRRRVAPARRPTTRRSRPSCRSAPGAGGVASSPSARPQQPSSRIVVGVLVVSPWSDDGTDQVAAVVEAADAVEIPMPGTGEPGSLPGVTIVHSASRGRRRAARRRGAGARGRPGLRAVGDPRRHARALRHVPPRRRRAPERLRRRASTRPAPSCGRSPRSRPAAATRRRCRSSTPPPDAQRLRSGSRSPVRPGSGRRRGCQLPGSAAAERRRQQQDQPERDRTARAISAPWRVRRRRRAPPPGRLRSSATASEGVSPRRPATRESPPVASRKVATVRPMARLARLLIAGATIGATAVVGLGTAPRSRRRRRRHRRSSSTCSCGSR